MRRRVAAWVTWNVTYFLLSPLPNLAPCFHYHNHKSNHEKNVDFFRKSLKGPYSHVSDNSAGNLQAAINTLNLDTYMKEI